MNQDNEKPAAPDGFVEHYFGGQFNSYFGPVFRHEREPRLRFRVGLQHLNPAKTLHGGALATFADMMVAAHYPGAGSAEMHCPTINMSIDYVATATLGHWVEAQVTLVRKTSRMIFLSGLIQADGETIARASGIHRIYA